MANKVSVIVCTYNRLNYLKKCLEHLALQQANKAVFEVVIVNNNSTDGTEAYCLEYISQHPEISVAYFNELNQGHTYSRNRGIEESSGDLLAFLDDDAFVRSDYVDNIIDFFNKYPEAMAIGGKIVPVFESGKPSWMSKYLMPLVSALDMGSQVKLFKGRKFPIGANMVFRNMVFEQYGLFNVELGRRGASGLEGGDEKEVFLRLKKAGEKIYYVPDVEVGHIIPDKRIQRDYIKGLATGVGTSERKRVTQIGVGGLVYKTYEEGIKIMATMLLLLIYVLRLQPSKGIMLVKFRYWVIKGLIEG